MNSEGYQDLTAEIAISNVEREHKRLKALQKKQQALNNANKVKWQKSTQKDFIRPKHGAKQEKPTQNRWVVYANGVSRMAKLKPGL